MRFVITSAAVAMLSIAPVLAQQAKDDDDTVEELASEQEVAKVNAEIAKIGCKATRIEKESPRLFEIDDAVCEIGQYDIKLNGDFKITSMTLDE